MTRDQLQSRCVWQPDEAWYAACSDSPGVTAQAAWPVRFAWPRFWRRLPRARSSSARGQGADGDHARRRRVSPVGAPGAQARDVVLSLTVDADGHVSEVESRSPAGPTSTRRPSSPRGSGRSCPRRGRQAGREPHQDAVPLRPPAPPPELVEPKPPPNTLATQPRRRATHHPHAPPRQTRPRRKPTSRRS